MKNKIKNIVLAILAIQFLSIPALAIDTSKEYFTDITELHENYQAIQFLKENNIINGYNDNTFRADNTISRAEFLKIIIESSNKDLITSTENPFTDIKKTDWYAPYAYTAQKEEWINGYTDGSFKPNEKISKTEALKIIAKAQSWNLSEKFHSTNFIDLKEKSWYVPYVQYANHHSFLEEVGEYYKPNEDITRAGVAELIFRNLSENESPEIQEENNQVEKIIDKEEISNSTEDLDRNAPPTLKVINFTPVNEQEISKDYFEDIVLSKSIPNTFYINEVYEISGKTKSSNTATIFINKETSDENQEVFRQENDSESFNIPIYFKKPGNYKIGIINGESGTSKIKNISVVELPQNNNEKNTELEIEQSQVGFENDKTTISFQIKNKDNTATITQITFTQNSNKVSYITRQDKDILTLNYKDFIKFNTDKVSYTVKTAELKQTSPLELSSKYKVSEIKSFIPTNHRFQKLSQNKITTTIPEKLTSKKEIIFTGKSNVNIKKNAYIIKPDGFVDTIELETKSISDDLIEENTSFTFKYTPAKTETYIIEITDENGLPLINTPIYIGNKIPLLPNYFDTNERIFFADKLELPKMREEMLEYINNSRKQHGLEAVVMETELNELAQAHSEDMAAHNFFAHINKDEETPEDRRKKTNIKTPVSENIAKDVSIEFAHLGLMRSATHRENILSKGWDNVGIGIATTDGYLLVTEEFSSNEVDEKDLIGMETELLQEINKKRATNNINEIKEVSELNDIAIKVNKLTEADELTSEAFKVILREKNITNTTQAIGRVFYSWDEILKSILDDENELFTEQWTNIGIAIEKDSDANIITTIIITE